jgi:hypothetical protein
MMASPVTAMAWAAIHCDDRATAAEDGCCGLPTRSEQALVGIAVAKTNVRTPPLLENNRVIIVSGLWSELLTIRS